MIIHVRGEAEGYLDRVEDVLGIEPSDKYEEILFFGVVVVAVFVGVPPYDNMMACPTVPSTCIQTCK